MKRLSVFLLTILICSIAFSCTKPEPEPEKKKELKEFPGMLWNEVLPSEVGFSDARMAGLDSMIRADGIPTTSMMVVVHGNVIFSYGDVTKVSIIASCRKSLLAMIYGKYVENGTIDLNKTVGDLGMDDIGGLLPIEKQATIRDLISARSGVYHLGSNTGDDRDKAPARGSQQPGTYFLYNNWDFNAAGYVFEKLTGKGIYKDFYEQVAERIGCQDFKLGSQRKSGDTLNISIYPAYHFYLSTRDMARIGLLMLHDGKWNGVQLISEDWAKKIHSVITPRAEMNPSSRHNGMFSYGYMWWVFDNPTNPPELAGAYTARGSKGQYITVIPELDMVVAHHTSTGSTEWSQYVKVLKWIFDSGTK